MFKGDMKEQGEKLMKMLDQAVGSLDNVDALITPLKEAGKAHKDYGVKQEDYDKVGASLLWTLEQGLGEGYTPDVEDAWATTYKTLSSVMIEGADYGAPTLPVATKQPWWRSLKEMWAT